MRTPVNFPLDCHRQHLPADDGEQIAKGEQTESAKPKRGIRVVRPNFRRDRPNDCRPWTARRFISERRRISWLRHVRARLFEHAHSECRFPPFRCNLASMFDVRNALSVEAISHLINSRSSCSHGSGEPSNFALPGGCARPHTFGTELEPAGENG